jgi:hypothetical protein
MKKIELDWSKLDGMLQYNASLPQCAELLEVSEDTIERRIKAKHKCTFHEYKQKKMGRTSIRLQQKAITMGLDGSIPMLIFCLKNIAKWSDNPLLEEDSSPPEFVSGAI